MTDIEADIEYRDVQKTDADDDPRRCSSGSPDFGPCPRWATLKAEVVVGGKSQGMTYFCDGCFTVPDDQELPTTITETVSIDA